MRDFLALLAAPFALMFLPAPALAQIDQSDKDGDTADVAEPRLVRADRLETEALDLAAQRDDSALARIIEVTEIRLDELGPLDAATIRAIFNHAFVLEDLGRSAEAEPLYRSVIEMRSKVLGPDHPDTLTAMNNLAFVLGTLGRSSEALTLYEQVLRARQTSLGERHPETILSLANYAVELLQLGRGAEAEAHLAEALRLRREVLGNRHPDTLVSLAEYAAVLTTNGRLREARPLLFEALTLTRENAGPNHPDTLVALSNYAVLLDRMGFVDEAASIYEQALDASREVLGERHPNTLLRFVNYIYALDRAGRLKEAAALMNEAVPLLRDKLGDRHPTTLAALNNQAMMLRALGEPESARSLLAEVFEASNELLGEDHPFTLQIAISFADTFAEAGDFERSEALTREALHKMQSKLGDTHPQTLAALNQHAYLLHYLGRLKEAEEAYRAVLEARRSILGDDHRDTLVSLRSLASVLQYSGRFAEALPLAREYITAVRARGAIIVSRPLGSSAQFGRELSRRQDSEQFFADLLWESGSAAAVEQPPRGDEAFTALQLASAGSTSVAVQEAAASRFAASRGLGGVASKRRELEREWSELEDAFVESSAGGEEVQARRARVREQLQEIEAEVEKLDNELSVGAPEFFAILRQQEVKLDELRSILGEEEAVLLLVPSRDGTHSMVVTREGIDWKRSDKDGDAVAQSVSELRRGLEIEAGAEYLPIFDFGLAHELYADLIEPVEDALAGKARVYVVADGALLRLPLGTLLTSAPDPAADPEDAETLRNAPWLADRYALVQIPSVQSLVYIRSFGIEGGAEGEAAYAGFGAPVLGGEARTRGARSATLDAVDAASLIGELHSGGKQPLMNPDALRRLSSLPGTKTELQMVADEIGSRASKLWLASEMTESAIRRADLASTRILHLATHGFTSEEAGSLAEPGLVFTPPAEAGPEDDGYLAASEVVALDLDAARWVILSACNTASPSGRPGESGLSGLAQAFFYAGAESLLVSHWPVFDDIAPRLTTETLRRSEAGMPRAEALQAAMRQIRTDPKLDAAHPAVWAPFTLVGEGR